MATEKRTADIQYEPPALKVVGSIHELTLGCKDFTGSDGAYLLTPTSTLGSC